METLATSGLSLAEVGEPALARHWLRGGFPRSYLAESETDSLVWRKNFVQLFLERDLPQWGVRIPAATLLCFWTLLAHYHGQIWNNAEPARALGVSEPTLCGYLEFWKGCFHGAGAAALACQFEQAPGESAQNLFPRFGIIALPDGHSLRVGSAHASQERASWEGYAIEDVLKACTPDEAYFWATHSGAELDLLLVKDGRRIGVECKRVDAPCLTPSMRVALQDLELDRMLVV